MIKSLPIAFVAALAVLGSLRWTGMVVGPTAGLFHSLALARQLDIGYTPAQIETAYNVTPLRSQGIDGKGETIALLEIDTFDMSDIQKFDSTYGLPDPTIKQSYVGGKTFSLQNQGEATLDLEWAHALAPGAALQVYFLNLSGAKSSKADFSMMAEGAKEAVSNGAKIISMSFGGCTPASGDGYQTMESELATAEKQGVSVFASSGDDGAYSGPIAECGNHIGVTYPASDPSLVAVGGVTLDLNADNTINSESAWRLSGGGKGNPLPRASWQVMKNLGPGKYRYTPDVSFDANPNTGVAVYEKGGWEEVGGTSLGAPAWAAIWAMVREDASQAHKPLTAAPPLVYKIGNSSSYDKAFHDVTTGGNGVYEAKVGWSAVTGWGTPDVARFAAAILTVS